MWGGSGKCNLTDLKLARGLATTIPACGSQVLPEERVVQVATSVEVQQGSYTSGLAEIAFALGRVDRLKGAVQAVDVGLMVLLVVKLHDL